MKRATEWLGVCGHRAQSGEQTVLLLPHCWWEAWLETYEPLLLTACPVKWGQGKGGCRDWFYLYRSFEMLSRPGCLHRNTEEENFSNGKLGPVWIICFSLSALRPSKAWHSGVHGRKWTAVSKNLLACESGKCWYFVFCEAELLRDKGLNVLIFPLLKFSEFFAIYFSRAKIKSKPTYSPVSATNFNKRHETLLNQTE